MAYRMTPARRAALRKAQIASARKRRKGFRGKVKTRAKTYGPKRKANKKLRTAAAKKAFHQSTGKRMATGPGSYHKNINSVLTSKKTSRTHKALTVYAASPAVYLGSKARGAVHKRRKAKRR
jgi:hypothetical protein